MYSILDLIQRLNIGSGGTDLSGAEGAAACGAADYERYIELINLTHEPFRKLGEVCGFVVSLEPDPVDFYDGSDTTLIAGEEVTYTDEENLGATSVFTLTTSG